MRLPTVKLSRRNGRGGVDTLIVNQTDYGRNIASYVGEGWKVVSYRHGDAPDSVVEFMRKQDEKELARMRNPTHEASKDEERTYEARQNRQANIRTEPEEPQNTEPAVSPAAETPDQTSTAEPDWRKMKFFALKIHVKKLTGIDPANKAEAVAAMEAHEAGAKQPE